MEIFKENKHIGVNKLYIWGNPPLIIKNSGSVIDHKFQNEYRRTRLWNILTLPARKPRYILVINDNKKGIL